MRVVLSLVLFVFVSAWSVEAEDDVVPKCEFEKLLDPSLVCHMYDPTAKKSYPEDQKFCACPSFSECIRKDVIDPLTKRVLRYRFMCYKTPAPVNNRDFQDMTDGLLVEDPLDNMNLAKERKIQQLQKEEEIKETKLKESHYE